MGSHYSAKRVSSSRAYRRGFHSAGGPSCSDSSSLHSHSPWPTPATFSPDNKRHRSSLFETLKNRQSRSARLSSFQSSLSPSRSSPPSLSRVATSSES